MRPAATSFQLISGPGPIRPDGSFDRVIGQPGRLGAGALHCPTGVAITPQQEILIADAYNHQLQWFDRAGEPRRRVGHHLFWLWPRRSSSAAGLAVPTGASAGPDGLIHVADSGNHRIVMLSSTGAYVTDWEIPDPDPNVFSPEHLAASPDGVTLYATDLARHRILVLSMTPPS